ncbi:hypothetical protein [Terricaulis silvestris]|uniref:Uncharacterized protein n=1 Tax=Terricaulis silvestris TaxID=2686094 RepID=A0A6I6MQE4_9CAUL|nr:hypothetical protein [Terricaulis silvestris]QGZ96929.1 hypothetical protein DSM104635_03794 [Terricaulis silvestris]
MRAPLVAVFALIASADDASAQIDPLNWCPEGPSIQVASSGDRVEQAFRVRRTTLASDGSFYPTANVATLELQPLAPRPVQLPRPDLGLRDGALLTPLWVVRTDADVFGVGAPVYCATTGPSSQHYSPAVCLGDVDPTTQTARTAFHARIADPYDRRPFMWGQQEQRRRGAAALGRNQDWGILGAEGSAQPAFTRTLRLGAIHLLRSAEVPAWNRPAFNSINVEFALEGYEAFFRRVNEPLRIEDGWLVVTDVSISGAVAIERMTDGQWQAFQRSRCPAAG